MAVEAETSGLRARLLYPLLALPGTAWLVALFLVPFYGILAVAFSTELNGFRQPIPMWNPLGWDFSVFLKTVDQSVNGIYRQSWEHSFVYAFLALLICVAVGYPVAYYIARLAGRRRGLLLALILMPWWINYLTRMLAWVGLLAEDGYVNDFLGWFSIGPVDFLGGHAYVVIIALAYGYLPFFIVPLYASLDRLDQSLIEASRDLGKGSARTFFYVTLPLTRVGLITAMAITALPMFGDFYTNTLVSSSPSTAMIGNAIETALAGGTTRSQGASLVLLLSFVLLFFMGYYLLMSIRASKAATR